MIKLREESEKELQK